MASRVVEAVEDTKLIVLPSSLRSLLHMIPAGCLDWAA